MARGEDGALDDQHVGAGFLRELGTFRGSAGMWRRRTERPRP